MPRDDDLFAGAMAQPEAERSAWLERNCADEAQRRRVGDLAAAAASAGAFLEKPAVGAAGDLPDEKPGDRLGRYLLREMIGEGGWGVVWRAEQVEPVRRPVALKIIKLGMDTREVTARFEQERQSLALMDHPNIAQVLDAGATPTGRPYFVMELVQGTAITRFCDEQRLGVPERLRLFAGVCRAVQHAHQKGVIHRDLKPSNILVAPGDGEPRVKVIDFGIAKATAAAGGAELTRRPMFLGTPAYTSPEQMDAGSQDVDTRSDIYSLGIVLCELLCGRPPFDADALARAGYEDLRRIVRETEPPHPSSRFAGLPAEERARVAERRGTDPARLRRRLEGDLDWIILRCLEKDRRRRYDTATGLAADLQRHLDHEPVAARPPRVAYILRKRIQRHRVAFAAAAAIALLLVAGTGVSTWQARRALRAEGEALRATEEQKRLRFAEAALRQRAEEQALEMRRLAYASDMKLAQEALGWHDLRQARELLRRQRPADGEVDLRGWEWRHLWQQCRDDASLVLNGGRFVAGQLAASADGAWLAATRHEDLRVVLWSVATREPTTLPAVGDDVLGAGLAFAPTAPLLAIFSDFAGEKGGGKGVVTLWDCQAGSRVGGWTWSHQAQTGFCRVAFSADGTRLMAAGLLDVWIWSVPDGRLLAAHKGRWTGQMAMAPDFGTLAFEEEDKWVRVVDVATGRVQWRAQVAEEYVNTLGFSADGQLLATAGGGARDSSVRLWAAADGRPCGELSGHTAAVQRIVFPPRGDSILTAGVDQTVRVWDRSTRELLRTLQGHEAPLVDLAWLRDGAAASASRDGTIRIWDLAAPPRARGQGSLPGRVLRWRFSPDGKELVTLDAAGGVSRWRGPDFRAPEVTGRIPRVGHSYQVGKDTIGWPMYASLSATAPLAAILADSGTIEVWDWQRGERVGEVRRSDLPGEPASPVAFAERDHVLLACWSDPGAGTQGVAEWDLVSGRMARSWTYPSRGPWAQALVSRDARYCLTSWNNEPFANRPMRHDVLLIDRGGGTARPLPGVEFFWWDSAAISDDARWLASPVPSAARTEVWELEPFRRVQTLDGAVGAAFSPDGSRLALSGQGVDLWDTAGWQRLVHLASDRANQFSAGFSPDGGTLVAWSQFNELAFWWAPSWSEIAAAEGGTAPR